MAIKVSGTTVVDDSRNITNVIGVGDTATTVFYGDGSGLTNTGATLSASSGSQRLVVTSETTGIMTTSATDADLTWNSTTNTLSATNVSIAGTLTYEDVTNVDSIGIVTARSGAHVATLSGNLLVGDINATGTALQRLQVFGSTYVSTNLGVGATNPKVQIQFSGKSIASSSSPTLGIATGNVYITNLDQSYGLLIGNYSSGSSWMQVQRTDGTATAYNLVLQPSGGNVGVATASPSEKLHVIGNILASGNVTGYSDETLKDNVQTIPDALDKVIQLRGVEFDRNDIEGTPHQIGVIAQEVEKIIPEVVTTHEDGIKSVAYGNLVGLLIEAIKDLKEEVNELKARLEEV